MRMVAENPGLLFDLGQVVATPAALEELRRAGQTPLEFLLRHGRGDWGDVCEEDAASNARALRDGARLLSAYSTRSGQRLWVISEAADAHGRRSATTLLLPSEY
jgi:hypothetical protein